LSNSADVIETLKQVNPDGALLVAEVDPPTAGNAVRAMRAAGLIAVVVRGRKMRTRNALYDELGAALQFPSYFGENWNAVHECAPSTYSAHRDVAQPTTSPPGRRRGS
jgi:hypothetical protein